MREAHCSSPLGLRLCELYAKEGGIHKPEANIWNCVTSILLILRFAPCIESETLALCTMLYVLLCMLSTAITLSGCDVRGSLV